MKILERLWRAANGKKTVIAALAGLALSWAQAKGFIGADDSVYLAAVLTIITGVAVGHKAVKSQK